MSDKQNDVVEIWKKTVEVQQHFNDIAIKIRNLAVTVLAALLSAAALSLKEDMAIIGTTPLASFLLGAGLVAWVAFYMMDRFWYHRLLIGAVRHGESIEKKWREQLPEMQLAVSIRNESAIHLWKWKGKRVEFRSPARVDAFYGLGALILFGSILGVNSIPIPDKSQPDPTAKVELKCDCTDKSESKSGPHY